MTSALCGCVRVEQDLVILPDGSGSVRIVYGVKDEDLQRMRMLAAQMALLDPSLAPADVDWMTAFDETIIRQEWDKMDYEGLALRSVQTELKEGWRFMRADIRFDTLQHVLDAGLYNEGHISLTRGPDGQYGYQQSLNLNRSMKALPPGMAMSGMESMLAMMLKDFHATISVEAPGDILRSNADRVEGRKAVWVLKGTDPKVVARIKDLDLRLMFEGRGVTIPDASM
jgi:hypothetical protein